MSVASEILRIQGLVNTLRTKIQNKGVTLANDADLEDCVDAVDDIEGGGGTPTPTGYEAEYFTITPNAGSVNVTVQSKWAKSSGNGLTFDYVIEYSFDKETWTSVTCSGNSTVTICTIPSDGKCYFRSTSQRVYLSGYSYGSPQYSYRYFYLTSGGADLSGNIMSLVYGDDFAGKSPGSSYELAWMFYQCPRIWDCSNLIMNFNPTDYCCYYMFYQSSQLQYPPQMSFNTARAHCFQFMFSGCSNLVSVPTLGATTLAESCYGSMFQNCTALASVPSNFLPATKLAKECYSAIFYGCNHLANYPTLPATTLAESCYNSMFYQCTSLPQIPNNYLIATVLATGCYGSMFGQCTQLTSIPSGLLPVTTLAPRCYYNMFENCSGLTSIPSGLLPASLLENNCYQRMFFGCGGLTSIPSDLFQNVISLASYCYDNMFNGCIGLTSIPSGLLPLTTLPTYCYQYMFYNCQNITSVPSDLLPATTLSSGCYRSMFYGCLGITAAPTLPATTLQSYCYQEMFCQCYNINSITCLAESLSATNCLYNWLQYASGSGTFTKKAGVTFPSSVSGIPSGWTIVEV